MDLENSYLCSLHEPYESPIEHKELLKTHETAAKCESIASSWLESIENKYSETKVDVSKFSEKLRAYSDLQSISIGDYVAESEAENLSDYFVITSAY